MKTPRTIYLTRAARGRATAEDLQAAAGLARADADRILKSTLPVPVGHVQSDADEEGLLARLRARGLDGVSVTPEELRAFCPLGIQRVDFGPPLALVAAKPLPLRVEAPRVDTIVLGKVHDRRELRTRTDVDPAVAAGATYYALGTPGVPRNLVDDETLRVSTSEESFIALIGEDSWIVRENDFDYRATLGKPEATRERSLLAVLKRLRESFPGAHFDDAPYRRPAKYGLGERRSRTRSGVVAHSTTTENATSSRDHALQAAWLIHRTR